MPKTTAEKAQEALNRLRKAQTWQRMLHETAQTRKSNLIEMLNDFHCSEDGKTMLELLRASEGKSVRLPDILKTGREIMMTTEGMFVEHYPKEKNEPSGDLNSKEVVEALYCDVAPGMLNPIVSCPAIRSFLIDELGKALKKVNQKSEKIEHATKPWENQKMTNGH